VTTELRDQSARQLEVLKAVAPGATRVAVIYNPDDPASAAALKAAEDPARKLGVTLQPIEVRGVEDSHVSMMRLTAQPPEALQLHSTPSVFPLLKRFVTYAENRRVPTITGNRGFVADGVLVSVGPSFTDIWRQAGASVDKLLKGAKPADVPLEPAAPFEIVVNRATAKAIGFTLPEVIVKGAVQLVD
jgi:putative ABC transport system substrate-binding protein